MFQIEQTYQNFQTGEKWTKLRPQMFKLRRNAEAAAQRCYRWRTKPTDDLIVDVSNAKVIETPNAVLSGAAPEVKPECGASPRPPRTRC
jgi:hypothetical protein